MFTKSTTGLMEEIAQNYVGRFVLVALGGSVRQGVVEHTEGEMLVVQIIDGRVRGGRIVRRAVAAVYENTVEYNNMTR